MVKSGRVALAWLINKLKPSHAWLPRYTCEVLYDPFNQAGIPYTLYSVNDQFVPIEPVRKSTSDLLVYINYNDGCRNLSAQLSVEWKHQLIVDNTQAFFWKPTLPSWSFNSARKWMGVADGASLYAPVDQPKPNLTTLPENNTYITTHLELRRDGFTQAGYDFFQQNEKYGAGPMATVSHFSKQILHQANTQKMIASRLENFQCLHTCLHHQNTWVPQLLEGVPMYYPFIPQKKISHEDCWQNFLYVPRLWPEVISATGANGFEQTLAENMLPLPIDHRYTTADMIAIAELLIGLNR